MITTNGAIRHGVFEVSKIRGEFRKREKNWVGLQGVKMVLGIQDRFAENAPALAKECRDMYIAEIYTEV